MVWQKDYGQKYNLRQKKKGRRTATLLWNCKWQTPELIQSKAHFKASSSKSHTMERSGNLYELESPPYSKSYKSLRTFWFMLRTKAENQALDAWCHLYIREIPRTRWIKHIWCPIQLHGQRKGLLVTSLLLLITQLSELKEETHLPEISFTFSSVTLPHWCDGHIQSSSKRCWNVTQCDACNNATKDGSRNSKFGAPFKKETITFSTWNLIMRP